MGNYLSLYINSLTRSLPAAEEPEKGEQILTIKQSGFHR